jgi:hypothetical protein
MDAGETTGNGKTGTDGDFFVTVDPRNWKRLKEEEEDKNGHAHPIYHPGKNIIQKFSHSQARSAILLKENI